METLVLIPALQLAVSMRVIELQKLGYIPDYIMEHIKTNTVANIIEHGDDLQFGGKYCKRTFNDLALAISVLSFRPSGITIFGLRFESKFKN